MGGRVITDLPWTGMRNRANGRYGRRVGFPSCASSRTIPQGCVLGAIAVGLGRVVV